MLEKIKTGAMKEFVSKSSDKSKHSELIGSMFHCRDFVHLAHLKSKSYSEHVALNDLYDSILESADEICELIQGYVGILDISIPVCHCSEPVLSYLKSEQKEYIQKIKNYEDMPDVQNKLQDLLADFSKTIYKLENLK